MYLYGLVLWLSIQSIRVKLLPIPGILSIEEPQGYVLSRVKMTQEIPSHALWVEVRRGNPNHVLDYLGYFEESPYFFL